MIIISDIREEVEAGNTDQRSDGKSFTVWNYSVTALNEILGIFVAGTKHDFFLQNFCTMEPCAQITLSLHIQS